MSLWELAILAIGLSMDAFAVAMCKGACYGKSHQQATPIIALSFGFFQALMPLIGYLLGSSFIDSIQSVDHYIAFGLLLFLGLKLIREAIQTKGEELVCTPLGFAELMMLSLATSIDALAAGIALAALTVNIWKAISGIGVVTFLLSYLGVEIGRRFGSKYQTKAQFTGGIVLILIGVKVLIEHLISHG